MKNRELVQLAKTWHEGDYTCGMMVSEKLDGMRALWLPETMGLPIEEVGWANTEHDSRAHICTGLWSRHGKVIHAPLAWLGNLPKIPLDGELWLEHGKFQRLMSIVKKLEGSRDDWRDVKYKILDCPSYNAIYQEGRVYSQHYKTQFVGLKPLDLERVVHPAAFDIPGSFEGVQRRLKTYFPALEVHYNEWVPNGKEPAERFLEKMMKEVVESGGEGLILRNPSSIWEPVRSKNLLKLKPSHDDEAVIVGITPGKGKYKGKIGAFVVVWKGVIHFQLSGMTDRERSFPGAAWVGKTITFRYRELSDNGIPKEARYLRVKVPE